jgi:hypothetical protein
MLAKSAQRLLRRHPTMPRFLLILRRDADADRAALGAQELAGLLADYHAWREQLGGRVAFGELLGDHGRRVDASGSAAECPPPAGRDAVDGVYVVDAADYDDAVEIGRGHPSLRFGSIEVRQLDGLDAPGT